MPKQTNILFLMTDQHRWDCLGIHNPIVKTPNLDQLARRGVLFSNAICNNPMCVPSRYSMMTGLYSSHTGVRHNTQMCPSDDDMMIPTLPERLRGLGYQTAGFGKMHWYINPPEDPDPAKLVTTKTSTRGFEVRVQARGMDPQLNEQSAMILEKEQPEGWKARQAESSGYRVGGENALGYMGLTSHVPMALQREGWLTDKAIAFLDGERDPSRPLFLYLSFDFPHAGLNIPPEYEALYNLKDISVPKLEVAAEQLSDHYVQPKNVEEWRMWREDFSEEEKRRSILRYYAACTLVDDMFGRLIRKLEQTGELENTTILFTSDHGEMLGERIRFSKYCLYEGSVRVPLILAGRSVEGRGVVDDRCADLVDIAPTLIEVAGGEPDPRLVGYSLLQPSRRRGSLAELHGSGYHEHEKAPAVMWRTPEWKLILYLPGEFRDLDNRLEEYQGELFHLKEDPKELHNLYEDPAYFHVREHLTRQLLLHMAVSWSRFPRPYSYTDID